MSQQVVLYDLPSRPPCQTWSLNPWKTRLYLNYKKIPYKTEWIEYPDLKPVLSQHMAPNPPGSFAEYTIPTVILPDGTYVQESLVVAKRLEEIFPDPPLKIDSKYLDQVTKLMDPIRNACAPDFMYKLPKRVLNEKSVTWWYPDRERRMGMTLDQLYENKGGEKVTAAVAPNIKKMGELLKENPGPFFEGEHVTYADFVWAGFLRFMERVGPDTFDNVVCEERETHLKFLEACRPWLERDDH